jgi:CBS domain-containing protein
LDRGYGSLPVCDDDVNLIGIVSEDDLLETLLAKQEVKNIEAGDVMTKAPMTVTEDTQILDVIKLLDEHKLMRIPVVDGTRLVGILTRRDVLFCYLKATSASTKLW